MKLITDLLTKELNQEATITRKMLELVPDDKYDWKPHQKSMTLQRLATHIAELPGWVGMTLNTNELDLANNNYQPETINNNGALMAYFEKNITDAIAQLGKVTDNDLQPNWILRNDDHILLKSTKGEVVRTSISQIIHHRAQLGVYLRLLNIPIPGSYGPSADDLGL